MEVKWDRIGRAAYMADRRQGHVAWETLSEREKQNYIEVAQAVSAALANEPIAQVFGRGVTHSGRPIPGNGVTRPR